MGLSSLPNRAETDRKNNVLTEDDRRNPHQNHSLLFGCHRGRATTPRSAIDPEYADLMEQQTAQPEKFLPGGGLVR